MVLRKDRAIFHDADRRGWLLGLASHPSTFMTRFYRIHGDKIQARIVNQLTADKLGEGWRRVGMREWMKAREPSSLLRLRSSFVVIPSGEGVYPRLAFPIFEKKRTWAEMGEERAEKIAGVRFPRNGQKGIIIISRELGLLKRKQTPLPGKNRLGWNVLPSR